MPITLLDPKNDFVFKKQFANAPDLLADLINAVCSDEAPIEILEIFNPRIDPEELTGKYIILDVLGRDSRGNLLNIEMQVRALTYWIERSLYYLTKTYTNQLKRGGEYATLKPVIGINLLDFDLLEGDQAHWHFQLCDRQQPKVALDTLQLHVLELRKIDRQRESQPGTLADRVAYFKHWQEDTVMSEIRHPPVQKALKQLKELSQDEDTFWQAIARERALFGEANYLAHARERGHQEGRAEVLARLLTLKFGELPAAIRQRLDQASVPELNIWTERVLFADNLDDIF